MTDILLWAILLVLLGTSTLAITAFIRIKAVFLSFVTPPDEKQPSALAKTFELIADMIARSLMAQVKGFLMAQESAEKRAQYAMDDAGNPLSSLVPRSLRRNPLMAIATKFLASKLGGYQGMPSGNHQPASIEAPKFRL